MHALLLSAGLGTRFRPLTERIAKPAIPFLNVPLIGYSLAYLEELGLENLVFNTHHLPRTIESVVSCLTHGQKYTVRFSHEPKILGSGGGIKNAEKLLSATDDFIVANADEIILFHHENGFAPLLEFHKKQRALATLLVTDHPEAGRSFGGVWADTDHRITRLGERIGGAQGSSGGISGAKHFTGVYVFSPEIFARMPNGEFHIFKDCLHMAMARGEKVLAYYDPDLIWLDTSSEKDYLASTGTALNLLRLRQDSSPGIAPYAHAKTQTSAPVHPSHISSLTKILHRFHQKFEKVADRLWLCAQARFLGHLENEACVFMGPESEIGPDVVVKGFAVVGARARLTSGLIENAVIVPGMQIAAAPLKNKIAYPMS